MTDCEKMNLENWRDIACYLATLAANNFCPPDGESNCRQTSNKPDDLNLCSKHMLAFAAGQCGISFVKKEAAQ